jgi:Holliday junction DNA helicase RuvA
MIRQIRGVVLEITEAGAVLDVSGWGVFVYLASLEGLVVGKESTLKTYLAVKQDGVDLYGFLDSLDQRFFEQCLGVPGVGPKTALSILKRAPRAMLEGALAKRDVSYLTRVVGLGKKSAEKMIVELAEKMKTDGKIHDDDGEVFDTLVALGYTEREARGALNSGRNNREGRQT